MQLTDIIATTQKALEIKKYFSLRFLIPLQREGSYGYYGNIAYLLERIKQKWTINVPFTFIFTSFGDINLQQFIQIRDHLLFHPIRVESSQNYESGIKEAFYKFREFIHMQEIQNPILVIDQLELLHKRSDQFIYLIEELLQILQTVNAPKLFFSSMHTSYSTYHPHMIPFYQFFSNFNIRHIALH